MKVVAASLINSLKGTFFTATCFRNPFLLVLQPPSAIQTILLAPFHSDSASNHHSHLTMCQKITKLDHALQLFDQMTQRQPLPSVVKFNQLLQSVTKMKHYSCSIHLFKQMTAIGVPVDVYTTNIVTKCCCQMSCTSEGFAVVAYGFRRGVDPDVYTFSTLLNGLILEDRILEAERLFKKLIKGKLCEPNVVMYTTMIKGLCKVGINDTAIGLLRLMDEKGCKPDVMTYSTIIDSLCKDKMIDDALKLFNEMILHKGILPDVVTYSSLIRGLCSSGDMRKAKEIFDLMKVRGHVPDVVTYSSLLNGYCKKSKILHLFHEIMEKGIKPNVVTYNTILQGLFRVGRCKDAFELFKEMQSHSHIPPNAITYRIVLEGLCNNRQLDEALSLFRMMGENELNLDIVAYTILIDGASKCGKPDITKVLFNELNTKGLNPDVRTYNVMISCFGREGLVREAKELFLQMEERGCPPDCVTYNVLLKGLLKNGQHDTIEMLLQKMDEQGFSVEASTCSMLLDHISSRSLDGSLLKLIGKLVPKEGKEAPCIDR
ncbi:hypothetical protein OSB04_011436 [Centaurea solstitialis]|uniref:Pentatricopeptide repeat-containing protein n=1 Tax=Centaurea solstitialis TaxID=347529 RepID=A0AA38WCX5_9ASTR|nr:hypothetical protein OSB04_011436 [Centaurea solstitialis]